MLLVFLYHRIGKGKKTSVEVLEERFRFLKKTVLPKNSVFLFKKAFSLTFDDGYFDFYHYVYPLLKKYNLQAILAISSKYIQDSSKKPLQKRIEDDFCTWEEIKEMADSGYVKIANHGFSHKNLLEKGADLEKEVLFSKELIEKKIQKKVNIFVYPFGKFNKKVHNFVKPHYKYILRIGSAFNFSFTNFNKLTYRIPADGNIKNKGWLFYMSKFLINTLRGR